MTYTLDRTGFEKGIYNKTGRVFQCLEKHQMQYKNSTNPTIQFIPSMEFVIII